MDVAQEALVWSHREWWNTDCTPKLILYLGKEPPCTPYWSLSSTGRRGVQNLQTETAPIGPKAVLWRRWQLWAVHRQQSTRPQGTRARKGVWARHQQHPLQAARKMGSKFPWDFVSSLDSGIPKGTLWGTSEVALNDYTRIGHDPCYQRDISSTGTPSDFRFMGLLFSLFSIINSDPYSKLDGVPPKKDMSTS